MKKPSKQNIRPTKTTTDNIKAIVEIGFKNSQEMSNQNPFLERQQIIAEKQKLFKNKPKLNSDIKDDIVYDIKSKLQDDNSLEPHLTSTFNASMPFKDSLLGISSMETSNLGSSTVYAGKDSNNGFLFNPKNLNNKIVDSPKQVKHNKFELAAGMRHRSVPKGMGEIYKPKPSGIKLTNRDRGNFKLLIVV